MKHVTQQNNFHYFTAALLLLLLASAFVDSAPKFQGLMLVELFILITHVVAFASLNFGRYWRFFVVSMFVIIAATNLLNRFTDWSAGPLVALTFTLIFYVGVAVAAAREREGIG